MNRPTPEVHPGMPTGPECWTCGAHLHYATFTADNDTLRGYKCGSCGGVTWAPHTPASKAS